MLAFVQSNLSLGQIAAHLIAVIAWMAGMMYLPRLFVYHHQAEKGGEAERFFTANGAPAFEGNHQPGNDYRLGAWAF